MKICAPAFAALLLLAATPAGAQTMPLETFFSKAEALDRKGPLALLSSDYKLLKREMQASAAQLKRERQAASKAGQRPAYCPPARSSLSSEEILVHFRAIPPATRARMTVKDGFRSLMMKKHPCPK